MEKSLLPSAPQDRSNSTTIGSVVSGEMVALASAGFALIMLAEPVTRAVTTVLSPAGRVRSAGTFFPPFEQAFPATLRGLGIVMLAGGLTDIVKHFAVPTKLWAKRDVFFTIAFGLLVFGTFLLYAWLSYPHNAFPTNARIHWVDIFYNRRSDYFYTLVKLPHWLFYDYPHLLQGLNGALNCALVYVIGRRLFTTYGYPFMMASSYSISGLMLLFANGAEDVQLNITVLLLVVLAYLAQARFLVGVSLFAATLGRPQFLLFVIAFALTETLWPRTDEEASRSIAWRLGAALRNRFLIGNLLAFVVLFTAWHLFLAAIGSNWLFADSQLISSVLTDLSSKEVDGFTITPFGGAYFLHALWVYPLPMLVANAFVLVRWRRMAPLHRALFVLLWSFTIASITLSEYKVLLYYNVRYISYYWPLVLIASWLALLVAERRARVTAAVLAVMLAASPITTFHEADGPRRRALGDALGAAFPDRMELRRLAAGRPVLTTLSATQHRNYLAYLLKRPYGNIVSVDQGERRPGAVVFTTSPERYEDAQLLYRRRGLAVVAVGCPSSDASAAASSATRGTGAPDC